MCFTVHKDHKKIKIAEKNITCYKIFKKSPKKYLISPYRRFKYEKGELYYEDSVTKPCLDIFGIGNIHVGLHSYSHRREHRSWDMRKYVLVKCIIPKDSKYYYNPTTNEYVSDHLKIGTDKDIMQWSRKR